MTDTDWQYLPLTDLSYQILLVLAGESQHGYGILRTIADRTGGRLEPDTGTLYTALRRLKRDGLLEPTGPAATGRRGKRYRLTPRGRRVLKLESRRLANLVSEASRLRVLPPDTGLPRHV